MPALTGMGGYGVASARRVPLSFERCVVAAVEAVLASRTAAGHGAELELASAFVLAAHARLPDYLRLAFRISALLLDASSYPLAGAPFHRLSLATRVRHLQRWERAPLQICRAPIAFYRAFATFQVSDRQDWNRDAAPVR